MKLNRLCHDRRMANALVREKNAEAAIRDGI